MSAEHWSKCQNCKWEGFEDELIDDELCPWCGSSLIDIEYDEDVYDE